MYSCVKRRKGNIWGLKFRRRICRSKIAKIDFFQGVCLGGRLPVTAWPAAQSWYTSWLHSAGLLKTVNTCISALNPFTTGLRTFFVKNLTKNCPNLGGCISEAWAKFQKPDEHILVIELLCDIHFTKWLYDVHKPPNTARVMGHLVKIFRNRKWPPPDPNFQRRDVKFRI